MDDQPAHSNGPFPRDWDTSTWSSVSQLGNSSSQLSSVSSELTQIQHSHAAPEGNQDNSSAHRDPGLRQIAYCDQNEQEETGIQGSHQCLRDPVIAGLFHHYVEVLASWYDLNDPHALFAELVPLKALHNSVLFKAIVALSASHQSRTGDFSSTEVLRLHEACLNDLIEALDNYDPSRQPEFLAATCLLRSYEILNGDTRNQDHLSGAFSFAAARSIDLERWGLVQAGFWNYVREDITVALELRRPMRMQIDVRAALPGGMTGLPHDHANIVTYILAKVIGFCWGNERHEENFNDWHFLEEELTHFRTQLPPSFSPYSLAPKPGNGSFPSLWMLRPYHVATVQYLYIASMLLHLSAPSHAGIVDLDDTLESYALKIIGLCSTNPSIPARVNSFGPLSFCGRYLNHREHRRALRELLWGMSKEIGWNVEHVIRDLCGCWGARDLDE